MSVVASCAEHLRNHYEGELIFVPDLDSVALLNDVSTVYGDKHIILDLTTTEEDLTHRITADSAHFIRRAKHCLTNGELHDHVIDDGITFDTAVPMDWATEFRDVTGTNPIGSIVWQYDEKASFGRPRPVTDEAAEALAEFNDETGSQYPTDDDTARTVSAHRGVYVLWNR
jgi:hypothetical protein